MNISAYKKDIVLTETLNEFPFFKEFFSKYENNIDRLGIIADRGLDEADFDTFDFYDYENEEESRKKVKSYVKNFFGDFEKVREKIKEKTGAFINIGYAEDEEGYIYGAYFYVENAFIKNPEIKEDFFKKIHTNEIIIENLDY